MKSSQKTPEILGVHISVILLLLQVGLGTCVVEFHRNTTGVGFSAYVHNSVIPDSVADWSNYTLNDIKIMMEVMSSRFSKIATFGVGAGADRDPYRTNHTYYRSFSQIYTAEAAALVNKEMSTSPHHQHHFNPLSVYVGIWLHTHPEQLAMEIHLAKESVLKANTIYPKTVQALVIGDDNNIGVSMEATSQALDKIKELKPETRKLGLRIGVRQKCDGLVPQQENRENPSDELNVHKMEIIKQSDFIICEQDPNIALGVTSAFAGVKAKFMQYKMELKSVNPAIEVMGQTGMPGRIAHQWEVDDLKEYWQLVDRWGAENNFTVWMIEAIDNPWKKWDDKAGHFGWWKLSDDYKTGLVEGYIEKAEVVRDETTTTTTSATTSKTTKKPGGHGPKGNGVRHESTHFLAVFALVVSLKMFL